MNLFLLGNSGVGKSTLLQNALAPYSKWVGGFSVQRLTGASAPAFRLLELTGTLPPLEAHINSLYTRVFLSPQGFRLKLLQDTILKVEKNSQSLSQKLILLDEIGGIELVSPVFIETLTRLLKGPIPCIGVVKSHGNLKRTLKGKVNGDYLLAHKKLVSLLLETGELLPVTVENRQYTVEKVNQFINSIMKGGHYEQEQPYNGFSLF